MKAQEYIHDEWCATMIEYTCNEECDCYVRLLIAKDKRIEELEHVLSKSKLADIIRIAMLRRKGRWVGLHWLWNKLRAWRWRDAQYEAWLEQERAEAKAMLEAVAADAEQA